MPLAPKTERRHHEFCQYGDCEAEALGGIRLSLCGYHAQLALEDAIAMDLLPYAQKDERERAEGLGVVYAIRFADRIKIGFSRRPERRLLEVPHDEVLALREGMTFVDERAFHDRIAEHRIKGEWFADVPAVRAVVADIDGNTPE